MIHFCVGGRNGEGARECYWGTNERRRSMAWLSSGKLDEVFRDAWHVYCQYSENDYAVAPVRLKSVRNLCRSKVLGLGLWGTLHAIT